MHSVKEHIMLIHTYLLILKPSAASFQADKRDVVGLQEQVIITNSLLS